MEQKQMDNLDRLKENRLREWRPGTVRPTTETGLSHWRDRWISAGIPVIPLRKFEKIPVCTAWQTRSPADQWQDVGRNAFRGNIGILPGQGVAVIDADALRTATYVEKRLSAMGLTPPTVKTVKKHCRHYYIRVQGAPAGNYALLNSSVGPGEFRWGPGACVTAPCSMVNGQRYQFTRGYPEQIPHLTPVHWRDLEWLLSDLEPHIVDLDTPPVRLIRRRMPDKAIGKQVGGSASSDADIFFSSFDSCP